MRLPNLQNENRQHDNKKNKRKNSEVERSKPSVNDLKLFWLGPREPRRYEALY